jgi:hypothetical protein
MIRTVSVATLLAVALTATASRAQHDDCYYRVNAGMAGPSRCFESNPPYIIGSFRTDTCVLAEVGGDFRQACPGGVPGSCDMVVFTNAGTAQVPTWAMTAYAVSASDNISLKVACVPNAKFAGGAFNTRNVGLGNSGILFAPGPDGAHESLSMGEPFGSALCSVRVFSGDYVQTTDSMSTNNSAGTWILNAWGNPNNVVGSAGCAVTGTGHLSQSFFVGPISPNIALPNADQALCGITSLSGVFADESAYISINVSGNAQNVLTHSNQPFGQPSATIECAFFQ